ncbi:hypothetical protein H8356DRAFT_1275395 [Neocallimastix lanati (nom. inval.)]|uniref:Uncharacterized protein n=1 Tax=Neocallimastix californiae TaxID=1754190 RepID=A0A1Y2ELC9_9FUNG|nr:hypothetical protein H8356DRAFT_1275395 [Neocallimastix sp. JGI-2020a]ORY72341.1 hypothetical protein LY90DRAFT_667216 [Neocallimastix californiae]|eukprot:ORY72341.1 hypothetical protein LY90DRAFT_667216 [Neocallimastix californiae]
MNSYMTEYLLNNINITENALNDITKELKIYVAKQERVRHQMLKLIQAFKNCITQIPSSSKLYIEALTNSLALIDYYLKLSDDRIIQRICKTFDFFSNDNCKLVKNYIYELKDCSKKDLSNFNSLKNAFIIGPIKKNKKIINSQENNNLSNYNKEIAINLNQILTKDGASIQKFTN